MKPSEYIKTVVARESKDFDSIKDRIDSSELRLLHSCMGVTTEAGEFVDALKRYIFYGKEIDKVNLVEELGDLMWYIGLAVDELGVSLEEVMEKNNAKLEARYGKAFSKEKAIDRDLETEREILEEK